MTEQRPETTPEDLTQTRVFQPIDPYGVGEYADLRPEAIAAAAAAADGEDEDDEPYPSLKERISAFGKARAALAAAAAVLVVGGIAWGTSAALASSDAGGTPKAAPTASAPAAGKHPKKATTKPARVTITSLAAGSFSGTTELRGKAVTVVYGDDTKFGNKARPLDPADLAVGMTVTVLGEESGDTITASDIGLPVKKGPATPGIGATDTPSATPAS
jgi:hypothetical protein